MPRGRARPGRRHRAARRGARTPRRARGAGPRRRRPARGRPARIERGIGLHARARLSWSLAERFSGLRAVAGISDEVLGLGARGSVVFRVLVDGEARFDSGMVRGGEKARRLPEIDLRGARELTVEVDFGDEGDVADRAVLCDAILVRG
ncbi:MAG: NPCBM/NEW2 domain-containing protein [Planctomycetes bacterium]|nr:NPCBM/NEW2 domain-containing protein [Planctomycetota bacterium]